MRLKIINQLNFLSISLGRLSHMGYNARVRAHFLQLHFNHTGHIARHNNAIWLLRFLLEPCTKYRIYVYYLVETRRRNKKIVKVTIYTSCLSIILKCLIRTSIAAFISGRGSSTLNRSNPNNSRVGGLWYIFKSL